MAILAYLLGFSEAPRTKVNFFISVLFGFHIFEYTESLEASDGLNRKIFTSSTRTPTDDCPLNRFNICRDCNKTRSQQSIIIETSKFRNCGFSYYVLQSIIHNQKQPNETVSASNLSHS